jgi:hypothetical protein
MSGQRLNMLKRLLTQPSSPGEVVNLQLYNNAPYRIESSGGLYPQVGAFVPVAFGEWDQTIGGPCPQNWFQNNPYYTGMKVTNGGRTYVATKTGVSAPSGGPTGIGAGITDGTIVWNDVGATTALPSGCGTASLNAIVSSLNLWGQSNYKSQDVALSASVNQYGHDSWWGIDTANTDLSGEPPQDFSGVGLEMDFSANGPDNGTAQYDPLYSFRFGEFITSNTQAWPAWSAKTLYRSPSINSPGSIIQAKSSSGSLSVYKMVGRTSPCASGEAAPTWPTVGIVADGTCVWLFEQTAAAQMGTAIYIAGDTVNGAYYGTGFATAGSFSNAVIDMSEASIKTSINPNAAGIRLKADMPIDFDGNGTSYGQNRRTLGYTAGGQYLYYNINGTNVIRIGDNGNDYFSGVMHLASSGSLYGVNTGYPNGLTVGTSHLVGGAIDLVVDTAGLNVWSQSNGKISGSPMLHVDGSGNSTFNGSLASEGTTILGNGIAAALNRISSGYSNTALTVGHNHGGTGETDLIGPGGGVYVYSTDGLGHISSPYVTLSADAGLALSNGVRTTYFSAGPNGVQSLGHEINTETVAPTVAQSGGTGSSALNAQATDSKGTVTEGTSATGFVLTFNSAYATAPDCIVTSPTGSAFTSYTPATGTLTVVHDALTAAKFTYHCIQ